MKNLTNDNIISTLARLSVRTGTSQKTNTEFHILTLHFKNGLKIDYFVDKKDVFGLAHAIKHTNKEKIDLEEEFDM
ncbi:MAG: hypothetical protein Q4A21_01055 [bacterium]|nr:hypothetical protein [bacterium]